MLHVTPISKNNAMRFRILAFLLLAWAPLAFAQTAADLNVVPPPDGRPLAGAWPLDEDTPFYAVSFTWTHELPADLYVRFGESQKTMGDWQAVTPDPHAQAGDRAATGQTVSRLLFAPAGTQWFELRAAHWPEGAPLHMHVYSPGHSTQPATHSPATASPRDCPCPLPAIQTRADWCPAGTCPPDPTPIATTFSHMIVHHSASSSTASDWAAVVRSIWDFHVNVNGWDDIGYNYLIAPDGTLFEGRGDNILGAHFCGTNTGAMGVCMMGTWINTAPPDTALTTLRDLLAWKSCDESLDPLGTAYHPASGLNLHRISGHRDGCSTQCPGQALYDRLPQLRQDVADHIANGCTQVVLPAPALQAQALSPSSIRLTWTDPGDETGFQIERSVSFNDNYALVATLGPDTLEWTDEGLTPNTGYFYRIRALLGAEASPWSNEVFLFTPLQTDTRAINGLQRVWLSPNPARTRLTLHYETTAPLRLTAWLCTPDGRIFGRYPLLLDGRGRQSLALSHLPKGQAYLYLVHAGGHAVLPFIKM